MQSIWRSAWGNRSSTRSAHWGNLLHRHNGYLGSSSPNKPIIGDQQGARWPPEKRRSSQQIDLKKQQQPIRQIKASAENLECLVKNFQTETLLLVPCIPALWQPRHRFVAFSRISLTIILLKLHWINENQSDEPSSHPTILIQLVLQSRPQDSDVITTW